MLVRISKDSLRVIRQHDHALASGRLAQIWIGTGASPDALSLEAVLGVALHDFAWHEEDRIPRLDPETGDVATFETRPWEERVVFYRRGLDEVERVSPYAALLASLHYGGFRKNDATGFHDHEEKRQRRLREQLDLGPAADERIEHDRRLLRLFDDLSLVVCLTGPASARPPDWLAPERIETAPDGTRFELAWSGDDSLSIAPFPLRAPVALEIPCRDLPHGPWSSPEALLRSWQDAPPRVHRVRLSP